VADRKLIKAISATTAMLNIVGNRIMHGAHFGSSGTLLKRGGARNRYANEALRTGLEGDWGKV